LSVSVNGLLANFAVAFTQPTVAVFALLFTGAVLVRGRHTVTRMILAAGVRVRHHARYHRFFSRSRWSMDDLWKGLVRLVAAAFLSKDRPVRIGGDDTAQKKTGAKIYGAGMVHDNRPAARKGWDLSWGLTWVVLTVLVRVPLWPNRVFAIPVGARLYRKKKFCRKGSGQVFQTKPQLLLDMVRQLAEWLPDYTFWLHVDGGYASGELMQSLPKNVEGVGRMRWDAALYDRPPKRQGRRRRGKAPERGKRLAPPKLHVAHRPANWAVVTLSNGKRYEVQSWVSLWWSVFRERPVRVVASRRAPRRKGDHPGDVQFFYTTDLTMTPQQVLESYAERWAIECLFHEVKERMGFEEPQCRTELAVERTAPFLLWTAGVVQYWFLLQNKPALMGWRPRWWNNRKASTAAPSFSAMLAALRRDILHGAFACRSDSESELHRKLNTLIESAAFAA
jgi:hypothetical protein